MKKALVIFMFLSLFFCSCVCKKETSKTQLKDIVKSETKDTNLGQAKLSIPQLKQSLFDSLNLFLDSTKIIKRDDEGKYVLFVKEMNKQKIGIIAITDSMLYLYQKIDGRWIQADSAIFDTYARHFASQDLNGDDREDFIVYSFGNMHGQSIPYVFICDKDGRFHYRSDIQLYNIQYEKDTKLVRSYYEGGAYSIHYKEYYRWQNDSLELVKGIELNLTKNIPVIGYYISKNEKRYYYKRKKLSKEGSSDIYDRAFWGEPYFIEYD